MGGFEVDLTNTPGIYYFIAYFLSSCLYISLNPKRRKGIRLLGIQLLFFLILGSFMIATDQIMVALFVPCILIEISIMWFLIYASCDMDKKTAAYFCIRAFILGEFAASLEWQLFYYGLMNWQLELSMKWNLFFLCSSHVVVFGIMYLLENRYRERNNNFQVTRKDLWISVFMGILVYVVSNMSYAFENTPFSSRFPAEILVLRHTLGTLPPL